MPLPAQLDPGLRAALERSGVRTLYAHQLEALRAAETANVIVTSGTASGKSLAFNMPVLDAIGRDPKARAFYLYPTKALAQDQARKLTEIAPGGLRLAIYDGDTPREERPAIRRRSNLILTNPDMLHVGVLPHHRNWGDLRQPPLRRRRRGPRLPRRLRLPRRQRPAPPAAGGRPVRLRAALHPHLGDDRQPARAGRAPGRHPVPPRRLRRRPEGRAADRDLEPAPDRPRRRRPPLGPLGGRRHAHRPADRRDADDLLRRQPARGGADPQVLPRHPDRARSPRPGRRDRPLPGRLHAPAAPRDRGPAELRRAAGGRRDQRARARDRHRRARRGDLRRLSGHRRQPPADVGQGRSPPRRPRHLPGRDRRPRPVLLPPSDRVPDPPGRGGDPRPPQRADPVRAPGRGRLRGAARRSPRRRDPRRGLARAGRGADRPRLPAQGPRRPARGPRLGATRPAGSACAPPPPTRSPSSMPTPASCSARSRPSAPSRPSIRAPSTSTSAAPTRSASSISTGAARSSSRSTATGTRSRVRRPRSTSSGSRRSARRSGSSSTSASSRSASRSSPSSASGSGRPRRRGIRLRRPRPAGAELRDPGPLVRAARRARRARRRCRPRSMLGVAARLRAHPDRRPAAAGDVRSLGHRRPLDQRPLQTGRPTIFIYDGHPGGVGISRRGYEEFERLVGDAARLVGECPCEEGCPSCVQSPKCGNLNDHLHKGGSIELMTQMLSRGPGRR